MNIQVCAHMRFTMYNQEIAEEDLQDEAERYGPTNEGIVRRAQYVFKNYGGPTPQQGVLGPQHGRGHGRGRGQWRGRGRCAADAQERVRGPIRGRRIEYILLTDLLARCCTWRRVRPPCTLFHSVPSSLYLSPKMPMANASYYPCHFGRSRPASLLLGRGCSEDFTFGFRCTGLVV